MMPSVLTEELAAVLRAVALTDFCEPSTIAKVLGHAVADQLEQLRAARLVVRNAARRADRTRTTLYTITASGRDQLRAHEINSAPRLRVSTSRPTVAGPRTAQLTTRGLYLGSELRPYDGRPGAMDAFALPSRMGGRLHYRDGTVEPLAAQQGQTTGPWAAQQVPLHPLNVPEGTRMVVGVDIQDGKFEFGPVTLMHESPTCAGFVRPLGRPGQNKA